MGGGGSTLLIKFTKFPGIYGGGGYLFGGTFLLLFYIGMFFASLKIQIKTKKVSILITLFSAILLILWGVFITHNNFKLDAIFPFGYGKNPPGISLMIYALSVGTFIFCISSLIEITENKIFLKVIEIFSFYGRYTLYIFLYHYAFGVIINKFIISIGGMLEFEKWILFEFMLFGPIILGYLFEKIKNIYKNAILKVSYNS